MEGVFDSQPASLQTWLSALRIHHWVKNALLFLPLLLAHRFTSGALRATTFGFLLFGLCSSSIYIVNDLLDLHSDRAHPAKSKRPFASGKTSIPAGLLISGVLAGSTIALGFLLNVQFGLVLILYILTTVLYSTYLKRVVLLDIFVLSSFYVIRIWAGAVTASGTAIRLVFGFFASFSFSAWLPRNDIRNSFTLGLWSTAAIRDAATLKPIANC